MNRKLEKGVEVYLILTPNNCKRKYRYVKCIVKSIYFRRSSQVDMVEYDDNNIPKSYKVSLCNVDDIKSYYCIKCLDKIYFEDELNQLNIDIENLNKILEFKLNQKMELKSYIRETFSKWKYKGTINI